MIAAVVIASGYSQRMGRSKLTLDVGGATFLERAVQAASGSPHIGRCLVVVRPEDAALVEEFRGPSSQLGGASKLERARQAVPLPHASGNAQLRVEVLLNDRAAEGQSASIRLAANLLSADPSCEAVIFSVVDQPFLTPQVFTLLAEAWQAGRGQILVSSYRGQRGNPALFGRAYFGELQELAGDVGGREVLRRHPEVVAEVEMPDAEAGLDVDTWEDYLRVKSEK